MHVAGPDVQDIFLTLPNTGAATDYTATVGALNTYFVPHVNAVFAHQTFHKLFQKQGETVQQFSTLLRQTARDCDIRADTHNQIRDVILSKCASEYVRRKLLEEGHGLTLARTLELASQCERIVEQMAAMSLNGENWDTETITQKGGKYMKARGEIRDKEEGKTEKQCYRCGYTDHMGKDPKCPACGQTCHVCNGKKHKRVARHGHLRMCRGPHPLGKPSGCTPKT